MDHTDSRRHALVIGGGPAGASAALGLLRAGRAVTLLEQRTRWEGRVCGSFLDPEAVRHLRWLGLLDAARRAGAADVSHTVVTTPGGARAAVPARQDGEGSLAFSRQALEDLLLDAVRAEGGRVLTGARARDIVRDAAGWTVRHNPSVDGPDLVESCRAELVVAAGGRFAREDLSPAPPDRPRDGWYGWNAAFDGVPQPPGGMSLHFYPGGYVGVLTFSDGSTNVCGLVHRPRGATLAWDMVFAEAVRRQPPLAALLRPAHRTSPWRGVGPLPFSAEMRASHGPLLAGDAAAVGDPFMGEGIGRALGAGPMIHEALRRLPSGADPSAALLPLYVSLWKRHYTARLRLGQAVRAVLRRPVLFRLAETFLFPRTGFLRRLTPLFHMGYDPRAVSA